MDSINTKWPIGHKVLKVVKIGPFKLIVNLEEIMLLEVNTDDSMTMHKLNQKSAHKALAPLLLPAITNHLP